MTLRSNNPSVSWPFGVMTLWSNNPSEYDHSEQSHGPSFISGWSQHTESETDTILRVMFLQILHVLVNKSVKLQGTSLYIWSISCVGNEKGMFYNPMLLELLWTLMHSNSFILSTSKVFLYGFLTILLYVKSKASLTHKAKRTHLSGLGDWRHTRG